MKAMQFKRFGGPEQISLMEAHSPQPGSGQILVKVAATSVNPIDWKLRSGVLGWITAVSGGSSIPCFDFVGEVQTQGTGVAEFQRGERVFGMLSRKSLGAAAEYVVVDEAAVARAPANLDDRSVAGMPLAGLTALQALRAAGQLRAGQRVLVIGAAGGVGHYGLQIAKALGAYVTGVCSTRNIEMVRGLGADEVIDYTREDTSKLARSFDVILDTVASHPFRYWRCALANHGVYVSLLPKPEHLFFAAILPLCSRQRLRITVATPNGDDLRFLCQLAEDGKLKTQIDSVYPLQEIATAFRISKNNRARGKIILTVRQ